MPEPFTMEELRRIARAKFTVPTNTSAEGAMVCRQFAKIVQSPTIRVIVGKSSAKASESEGQEQLSQRTYVLHIDRLKEVSGYFEGLFNFNGKETNDAEIRLEDGFDELEDFDAFDAFVQFLYTGSYFGPHLGDLDFQVVLSARVWSLADRLMANELKAIAKAKLEERFTLDTSDEDNRVAVPHLISIVHGIYGGSIRPSKHDCYLFCYEAFRLQTRSSVPRPVEGLR
ncbi:hypothetical protein BJ508DRAFT_309212 [Ascobolus immersus RN42]|uniref:BTB domain-containing protein n=1 Tax=Ascobolus immersus RN42 TaxID=1160509 RepID=A0A3N4I2I1_ASCIM|nr:hypothetical protein BJ508DRAFT_309212 [Ascobolus immersus RN42]